MPHSLRVLPLALLTRKTASYVHRGRLSSAAACTQCACKTRRAARRRGRALWFVGLPRRKSSLSMDGRSSWMSDIVCSISIAHAAGMAVATSPPTASHAARHRHGRTRLPPASSEYLARPAPRPGPPGALPQAHAPPARTRPRAPGTALFAGGYGLGTGAAAHVLALPEKAYFERINQVSGQPARQEGPERSGADRAAGRDRRRGQCHKRREARPAAPHGLVDDLRVLQRHRALQRLVDQHGALLHVGAKVKRLLHRRGPLRHRLRGAVHLPAARCPSRLHCGIEPAPPRHLRCMWAALRRREEGGWRRSLVTWAKGSCCLCCALGT